MARKSLVVYASHTGNTEKIALRFRKVFEEKGWECDCVKAVKNMTPVSFDGYDLVCVGSPVLAAVPAKEIGYVFMGGGDFSEDRPGGPPMTGSPPGGPPVQGRPPFSLSWRQDPAKYKKGIVFVTYTGSRRGPAEAMPSLSLLELQMEDKGYRCIGKLACPGKHAGHIIESQKAKPAGPQEMRDWHWNQQSRPHERDLQKAETFLAEILEDYFLPDEAPPDSQYICIA